MAPKVVDLESILVNWAWTTFLQMRSKCHRKLRFDDIKFEVVWKKIHFRAGIPEYTKDLNIPKKSSNTQIVFKSVYENKTDQIQDHTFQTERTTVSSCVTNITQGYTKGMNLELKLGLPDEVMSATAGFGREINMETSEESTHEESVTWSINSNIKVPPFHKTEARLVVREQEYAGSFKLTSRISGRAVVILTNLKDNNSFLTSIERDICEVMKGEQGKSNAQFTIDGKTVICEVKGTCHFCYGIEQEVQLCEEPLSKAVRGASSHVPSPAS